MKHYQKIAYPIKSKTGAEIAMFGTPRGILSNRGTEFIEVVDEMLKMIGKDHIVTAAYNPRCDGLSKRTNKTKIESLSIVCEKNPTDWPQKLPFETMCYSTRQHSTTRITQEYLIFGRERNVHRL